MARLATVILLMAALVGLACGNRVTVISDEEADPSSLGYETLPKLMRINQPEYPKEAKDSKIEGQVWVKALIDEHGHVAEAVLHRSSGSALLDDAAVSAAPKNCYEPGRKDGKPVPVWIVYRVRFSI